MCFIVYYTFIDMISFNPDHSLIRQAGFIHPTLNIRSLKDTKVSDLPKVTILETMAKPESITARGLET